MEHTIEHGSQASYPKRVFKIFQMCIGYFILGLSLEEIYAIFEVEPPPEADPLTISLALALFSAVIEALKLRMNGETDDESHGRIKKFVQVIEDSRFSIIVFTIAFAMTNRISTYFKDEWTNSLSDQLTYFASVFAPAFLLGLLYFKPFQNLVVSGLEHLRQTWRSRLYGLLSVVSRTVMSYLVAYEVLEIPYVVKNLLDHANEEENQQFAEVYAPYRFEIAAGYTLVHLVTSMLLTWLKPHQGEHVDHLWEHLEHLFVGVVIYGVQTGSFIYDSELLEILPKLAIVTIYAALIATLAKFAATSHSSVDISPVDSEEEGLLANNDGAQIEQSPSMRETTDPKESTRCCGLTYFFKTRTSELKNRPLQVIQHDFDSDTEVEQEEPEGPQ